MAENKKVTYTVKRSFRLGSRWYQKDSEAQLYPCQAKYLVGSHLEVKGTAKSASKKKQEVTTNE